MSSSSAMPNMAQASMICVRVLHGTAGAGKGSMGLLDTVMWERRLGSQVRFIQPRPCAA